MPGDDWIDTTGWNDDAPGQRLPLPGVREVTAICCPTCQSLNVSRYSTAAAVSYWRCAGCAENWKLPAAAGRERAYLL